jgi:hypothetical protein
MNYLTLISAALLLLALVILIVLHILLRRNGLLFALCAFVDLVGFCVAKYFANSIFLEFAFAADPARGTIRYGNLSPDWVFIVILAVVSTLSVISMSYYARDRWR